MAEKYVKMINGAEGRKVLPSQVEKMKREGWQVVKVDVKTVDVKYHDGKQETSKKIKKGVATLEGLKEDNVKELKEAIAKLEKENAELKGKIAKLEKQEK